MAAKTVATATVRAVKRKLLPTRQALILVGFQKKNYINPF